MFWYILYEVFLAEEQHTHLKPSLNTLEKMTATFYVFIITGALLVPATTGKGNSTSEAEVSATTDEGNSTPEPEVTTPVTKWLNSNTAQGNKTSSNVSTTRPLTTLITAKGTKETPTRNTSSTTGPPVTSINRTTGGNSTKEARPTATTRPVVINTTTKSSKTSSHGFTPLKPTPAPKDPVKPSKQTPNPSADKASTAATPKPNPYNRKKYIILIIFIIIMICLVSTITLCYLKRKSRRSSLDLHTKSEDAHIPLTPVAINVHDSDSPKDMETFTAVKAAVPTETAAIPDGEKDMHAPAAVNETAANQTAEKPDGDKAPTEADQMPKETSAEAQAPAAAVEKPSEMTIVDLNDPSVSVNTSVETLDDLANENNSNSKGQASVNSNGCMTEICLLD